MKVAVNATQRYLHKPVSAATTSPDSLILAYRGTDSISVYIYLWLAFKAAHSGIYSRAVCL